MSLDFSQHKSLTIDGLNLKQLFIDGTQVWKGRNGYKTGYVIPQSLMV